MIKDGQVVKVGTKYKVLQTVDSVDEKILKANNVGGTVSRIKPAPDKGFGDSFYSVHDDSRQHENECFIWEGKEGKLKKQVGEELILL